MRYPTVEHHKYFDAHDLGVPEHCPDLELGVFFQHELIDNRAWPLEYTVAEVYSEGEAQILGKERAAYFVAFVKLFFPQQYQTIDEALYNYAQSEAAENEALMEYDCGEVL